MCTCDISVDVVVARECKFTCKCCAYEPPSPPPSLPPSPPSPPPAAPSCPPEGYVIGGGCAVLTSFLGCTCEHSVNILIADNCRQHCGCCTEAVPHSPTKNPVVEDASQAEPYPPRPPHSPPLVPPPPPRMCEETECDNNCGCGICLKLISSSSHSSTCEDRLLEYASFENYTAHCYPENQPSILTPGGLCEGAGECGTSETDDNWFVYVPLKPQTPCLQTTTTLHTPARFLDHRIATSSEAERCILSLHFFQAKHTCSSLFAVPTSHRIATQAPVGARMCTSGRAARASNFSAQRHLLLRLL